jgi:hypothetical protein
MRALTCDLNDNQFNQRPPSGGWSIGDLVDHLTTFGTILLPRIDVAIDESRARSWLGNEPVRYPLLSRLFIKAVGPLSPNKRNKMKVPQKFHPSSESKPLGETVRRFIALQHDLIARCQRADGLNLRKAVVVSAVTPLVRLRLGAWIEAIAMHQLRHFAQIENVRAAIGLPAVGAE